MNLDIKILILILEQRKYLYRKGVFKFLEYYKDNKIDSQVFLINETSILNFIPGYKTQVYLEYTVCTLCNVRMYFFSLKYL